MVARPETEHTIGGAHPRALSSRRWKTTFQHIKLGRLFPQISGQSKGTTTGYLSCRSESLSPAAPKFFGRAARRVAPQSGRSMIEMLAVLAIMGVLTVGGIAAYTFAVSKHRANQIYNQVDLRAVASFGNPFVRQIQVGQTYPLPGFDEIVENITYQHKKTSGNGYDIIASHVPERVCRRLQDMTFPVPKSVTLNDGGLDSTCGADNTFVFSYDGLSVGKPSSVDPIDCNCSGCQSCESGTCQDNDNLCGPKEVCVGGSCQCAPGYEECGGSCYATCGEGYMRDPITCDCVCEPQECPEHASWDTATCSCICEDGYDMCGGSCHPVCNSSGMTGERDPNTCACTCIEGTNAETCACPEGYIYVDGQCQRFYCTGENGYCYINGLQCGTRCTNTDSAKAVTCNIGICRADICENDSAFGYGSFSESPYGMVGNWRWGCKIPPRYGLNNCYWRGELFFCFENRELTGAITEVCMMGHSKDLSSSYGVCELDVCTQVGAEFYQYAYHGGCSWANKGIHCYPNYDGETISYWSCSNDGGLCSDYCTDPPSCNGSCDIVNCPEGTIYDPEQGMCCDEGVCCSMTLPIVCYRNGLRCAIGCSDFGQTCSEGNCYDPGCDTSKGFTYTYNKAASLYGCYQESTGIACHYATNHLYVTCTLDGKFCGSHCSYNGICELPSLEECAPIDEDTGKKYCLYDAPLTDTCICKGSETNGHCCATGHTFTNGGCTLINCPEGQTPDENGICKTACENNAEVLNCVCPGTIYTNIFNAKICCESGYTWNENTQTCQ